MARRPRHLSPEEQRLWSEVARTASPLSDRPAKPVKPAKTAAKQPTAQAQPATPRTLPVFRIGETAPGAPRTQTRLTPDISARVAEAPLNMDRKAFRKLSRGRLQPQARIDLHGMTLAQAHPALTGFILRAHAAGHRLVLVITGKGRGGQDRPGPIPERRGALRDQVPGWLGSGPCAGLVLQVVQAHQSHGGGGAYYVYLRRQRD